MIQTTNSQPWQEKNSLINILLLSAAFIPFISFAIIPILNSKNKKICIYSEELELKTAKELEKAKETTNALIQESQRKIAQSEEEHLKTIAELDKKIENKQAIINEIITEAKKEAAFLVRDTDKKIIELNQELQDKEDFKRKISDEAKTTALSEISAQLRESEEKLKKIDTEEKSKQLAIQLLDVSIKEKESLIIELDEEKLLQSFALYKPQYDFIDSIQYKEKLNDIRTLQKSMIKDDRAATGATDWTVNENAATGRKMVNDIKKLLLRSFNSECEYVISKVKYNNFDSCLKRIESAFHNISKLGVVMSVAITHQYYELKTEELRLALEYQQKKQQEKEDQKELRARLREESKLQKEIDEARRDAEKERSHYFNAINKIKIQLEKCSSEDERHIILKRMESLEANLNDIDEKLKDIDYREANQKAGYVYVISNLGSFGENIYKIGMTRRLDPLERVNELGDASVPFNFDVHALIFSDNAPKLEATLHKAFEENKLNRVNARREFFNVSLTEIEQIVKENYDGSVEFRKTADAEQYRESLKLKKTVA